MISLLSILAIGFLFGMRHATDPDHVIAISTIVSRASNIKRASMIGVAWGVGHTLTIVAVGFLMIFFRMALPTRVGLAMELLQNPRQVGQLRQVCLREPRASC
jgi:high-affinity nickel permease